MKKTVFLASAAVGLVMISTPAFAGFEWNPPAPAPAAPPATAAPSPLTAGQGVEPAMAAPAVPVERAPISPFPGNVQPLPQGQPQGLVINPYPAQAKGSAANASLMDAILQESGTLKPVPSRAAQIQRAHQARVAATAPVVKAPSYPVVQGFGRDIPLAIAMSQVIPADFTYSFSAGVNPGESVSWQGGQPWDQVLNNMLSPHDLGARIEGRKVIISEGASPVFVPSAPVPVMDSQDDMMVNPALDTIVEASVKPVAEPVRYKTSSSAMVSRSSDLVSNYDDELLQPRPRVPARVSRLGGGVEPAEALPSYQEPVITPEAADADMVFEEAMSKGMEPMESVSIPEGPEIAQPAMEEPMQMTPRPIAQAPVNPPTEQERVVVSEPVPEWDAPSELRSSELKMASVPARSFDLNRKRTWRAVRGDSLRTVLTDWSDDAGVDITWNSQYDYPLDASVRTQGTFEDAVQNILSGLQDARPRPIGRLHPNLPDGPPALIIETQQVIE